MLEHIRSATVHSAEQTQCLTKAVLESFAPLRRVRLRTTPAEDEVRIISGYPEYLFRPERDKQEEVSDFLRSQSDGRNK